MHGEHTPGKRRKIRTPVFGTIDSQLCCGELSSRQDRSEPCPGHHSVTSGAHIGMEGPRGMERLQGPSVQTNISLVATAFSQSERLQIAASLKLEQRRHRTMDRINRRGPTRISLLEVKI